MYPECAQIQITGGGSRAPTSSELVSFPGAYSNTDPGRMYIGALREICRSDMLSLVTVNLYTQEAMTQYDI